MGGAISFPKAYWLGFALFVYYLVVPVLTFDSNSPKVIRGIFLAICAVFVLRAIFQGILMYRFKSWTTWHGITLNGLALLVLLTPLLWVRLVKPETLQFGMGYFGIVGLVSLCLIFDSYYAFQFNLLVEGQTTGKSGIWFASKEDPKFARINRLTFYGNLGLSVLLLLILTSVRIQ